MRIAILFDNLGPYHVARLSALSMISELLVLELFSTSAEYSWSEERNVLFNRQTLFDTSTKDRPTDPFLISWKINDALSNYKPDFVLFPGWGSLLAVTSLRWCIRNSIPGIVMSDSQEIDFKRYPFLEWVKQCYLSCCSGALVAGTPHRNYLYKLSFKAPIRLAYDVVDNLYFKSRVHALRTQSGNSQEYRLPDKYFLASCRFVEKKNIQSILYAFASFTQSLSTEVHDREQWRLVIIGDGELYDSLLSLRSKLGLVDKVHYPGFIQYSDLPVFYGLASAFVLASTTEQWGLVVNEAMASGLPVLVSDRCGCAMDLVEEGINGYRFDPYDHTYLSTLFEKVASDPVLRESMGKNSSDKIDQWSIKTFSTHVVELCEIAKLSMFSKWYDRFVVNLLYYLHHIRR